MVYDICLMFLLPKAPLPKAPLPKAPLPKAPLPKALIHGVALLSNVRPDMRPTHRLQYVSEPAIVQIYCLLAVFQASGSAKLWLVYPPVLIWCKYPCPTVNKDFKNQLKPFAITVTFKVRCSKVVFLSPLIAEVVSLSNLHCDYNFRSLKLAFRLHETKIFSPPLHAE